MFATRPENGETIWRHRLPGACWASPLYDGRHVYFFGVEGKTAVIDPREDAVRVVSENALTLKGRLYGVAAVDGAILLRTDYALLKISGARPRYHASRVSDFSQDSSYNR